MGTRGSGLLQFDVSTSRYLKNLSTVLKTKFLPTLLRAGGTFFELKISFMNNEETHPMFKARNLFI